MDEEGIGLVLARAAELRVKIGNSIQKATLSSPSKLQKQEGDAGVVANGDNKRPGEKVAQEEEEEEYDEEAEKLLNIQLALESLEAQLGNLQNLQLQQRYDREVALGEIEFSRKMLLEKLKEYKGEDLEVIHEASAFVGETVVHDNDLLLPPYPSRGPQSLILDNGYQSHYTHKSVQNGVISVIPTNGEKKNLNKFERNQMQSGTPWLGHFVSSVAKTLLPLAGMVYVITMSGFGQNLGKKGIPLKLVDIFRQPAEEEKRSVQCPSGKVLVVENGEAKCLVKERVEIPFNFTAAKPDINYGSG